MNETETPRFATYRVDELRPHPSYVKHQLSVPAFKISALDRLGDLAFQEPITITTDGIIIDGYARWELAKLRNLATIRCLAYQLTEDEALCYLLLKQRRSDGLNDFRRIELAFDLEPSIRENARANQQAGGRAKGSSTLTTAERVDRRKKIAQIADVSVGNVTKVRRILSHACSCVQQAVRSREISINVAERWSHESPAQQLENLRLRRIQRGIKKKAKELVMAHVRGLGQSKPDLKIAEFLVLITRLVAMSPEESNKLGPVAIGSVTVPGKGVFLTDELPEALKIETTTGSSR